MELIRKKLLAYAAAMIIAVLPAAHAAKTDGQAKGSKTKKTQPGADIFDNKHVLTIRIDVSTNELKALQRDNRKYARATVTEGTNVWRDVGIHVKGSAGSLRGWEDKAGLTLNFNKFTPDQKFHGLRKVHLNNSVQDQSYLTDNFCGEMFRKAGVPSARVSYATVEVNGRKKGFYLVREGYAREMLAMYFKNTKGNLYDGGFLREITDPLEKDSGSDDVSDWSDLKALAKAAQEQNATNIFPALSKVLDVDRFVTFSVLEVMTWDWDGYPLHHNNYRIYHDPDTGKMVFIPHGMDQMFWTPDAPVLPNMEGLVARSLFRTPEGIALYHARFGEVFTNVFTVEFLTNRIAELSALIRPALTNLYGANAGRDYDGQVNRIRDLALSRHANLEKKLSAPKPGLVFSNGIALVPAWKLPEGIVEQGNAKRDKPTVENRQTLHIQTTSETTASWRAEVMLESGHYRFEGLAKTAGVVPVSDSRKGEGAGIRISGSETPRYNKLVGDTGWQNLSYEFDAVTSVPVTLVCELRASKGEVWFDASSFKLVKVK